MASSSKIRKVESKTASLPVVFMVIEGMDVRSYADGSLYGSTNCLTSLTGFKIITPLIVPARFIEKIDKKLNKALLTTSHSTLTDGTFKLGAQAMLMDTNMPNFDKDMVHKFINPDVISVCEVFSLPNKTRVSVSGIITKISEVIYYPTSKKKLINITDGTKTLEIRLWGEKVFLPIRVSDSTVRVDCVSVAIFNNNISLNSTVNTTIKLADDTASFDGIIQAANSENEICSDTDNKKSESPEVEEDLMDLLLNDDNDSSTKNSEE